MNYYFETEGFEIFVILDRKGRITAIDKETDPIGKIKISGIPSFTTASGTQGATFSKSI